MAAAAQGQATAWVNRRCSRESNASMGSPRARMAQDHLGLSGKGRGGGATTPEVEKKVAAVGELLGGGEDEWRWAKGGGGSEMHFDILGRARGLTREEIEQ